MREIICPLCNSRGATVSGDNNNDKKGVSTSIRGLTRDPFVARERIDENLYNIPPSLRGASFKLMYCALNGDIFNIINPSVESIK